MAFRVVVLVSGSGTLLQSLIDAQAEPGFGAEIVAVGSDRTAIEGLERADRAKIPTFSHPLAKGADRAAWDRELTELVAGYDPDLIVLAGFMKLVGSAFLERFGGRIINSHPALLPSFPGMHGARDALEYGVKITGSTVFLVDEGVDSGAILDQAAVVVRDDDTVQALHERIKVTERELLVAVVDRMATHRWRIDGRKVRWDA
ncbi:MAG: phosphoribosylglycinamide formyltransferase [Microlunatus sp.]|nr:phosphoribosylglycinamide formyltransferase [Microlunatus sp.]